MKIYTKSYERETLVCLWLPFFLKPCLVCSLDLFIIHCLYSAFFSVVGSQILALRGGGRQCQRLLCFFLPPSLSRFLKLRSLLLIAIRSANRSGMQCHRQPSKTYGLASFNCRFDMDMKPLDMNPLSF